MAKDDIFKPDPNYDPSQSPIFGNAVDDAEDDKDAAVLQGMTGGAPAEVSAPEEKKSGGFMSKLGFGGAKEEEPADTAPTVDYTEPEKKPKLWARLLRVLIALSTPLICLAAAARVISSGLFLTWEYHRPGFPADTSTPPFNAGDRLHYGSYATDYLHNADGTRYLSDVVLSDGTTKAFTANEISHMADVKTALSIAMYGSLLFFVVVAVLGLFLFRKHNKGGMVRGFFAGSILTLVLLALMTFLAGMDWHSFFIKFHDIVFPNGNWQFDANSTLIRLFPTAFWQDAGMWLAILTAVFALIIMALSWPTKHRREKIRAARKGEDA